MHYEAHGLRLRRPDSTNRATEEVGLVQYSEFPPCEELVDRNACVRERFRSDGPAKARGDP